MRYGVYFDWVLGFLVETLSKNNGEMIFDNKQSIITSLVSGFLVLWCVRDSTESLGSRLACSSGLSDIFVVLINLGCEFLVIVVVLMMPRPKGSVWLGYFELE